MTKNSVERKRSRIVGLSQDQIATVKSLKQTDCPRCYCWWWHSRHFEFDLSALEGCKVDELLFQKNPNEPAICRRATKDPLDQDLHEPHESHLINDGFSPFYFFMAKANQRFVYLEAANFEGKPTEITKQIGFEPTKSWEKGEPAAPNSIYVCRQSGWRLYSSLPLTEPVEAHLNNLLSKLEMRTEAVKAMVNKFSLRIQVIDQTHDMNRFSLSNSILYRIYGLGLSIDFTHHHIPDDQMVE